MTELVICDIDGTLTKDSGIGHCLGDHFSKEEILRVMDPVRIARLEPNPEIVQVLQTKHISGSSVIALVTGRWNYLEFITYAWLKEHKIPFAALAMRKHKEWTLKSTEVKLRAYNTIVKDGFSSILWIDDDQEMIDIAEGLKINTIKVG